MRRVSETSFRIFSLLVYRELGNLENPKDYFDKVLISLVWVEACIVCHYSMILQSQMTFDDCTVRASTSLMCASALSASALQASSLKTVTRKCSRSCPITNMRSQKWQPGSVIAAVWLLDFLRTQQPENVWKMKTK